MRGEGTEKRDFTRVPVTLTARVKPEGAEVCEGPARDISLTGLFVEAECGAAEGTPCIITVRLSGAPNPLSIEASGVVQRTAADGVALAFTETDPESLHHLQLLMMYNAPDPNQVEEELDSSVGIKRHEGGIEEF